MLDAQGFPVLEPIMSGSPAGSTGSENGPTGDFASLNRRPEADPMRLHGTIMGEVKRVFRKNQTPWIQSQEEALSQMVEGILTARPGKVIVYPTVPGGGKSTVLHATAKVLSSVLADPGNPMGRRIGGITFVVQTSIEGHQLLESCNKAAGSQVATLIESANDSVLRKYGCPLGITTTYAECLKRNCENYNSCPYMRGMRDAQITPILIILHARYNNYLEDMGELMIWEDQTGYIYQRTLLLVDEEPNLFDARSIGVKELNDAENELDELLDDFNLFHRRLKTRILYQWSALVRRAFFRLKAHSTKANQLYGVVSQAKKEEAGIQREDLIQLRDDLMLIGQTVDALEIVNALLLDRPVYISRGQRTTVISPQLRQFDLSGEFATLVFSGTATLSPAITMNPQVQLLGDPTEESFARLTIKVQHGDSFSASRTAFRTAGNIRAATEWVKAIISQSRDRHKRYLVVTYKDYAQQLWNLLQDQRDHLIPYIDRDGEPQPMLPYFGGLHGSNQYLQATSVICVGLPRYEPAEYLSRALALDFDGDVSAKLQQAVDSGDSRQITQLPQVLDLQDITLANDLVQLVFRSALRMHGEDTPIDLWLLQPPNGVVEQIRGYFGDCRMEEVRDLPSACAIAKTSGGSYNGQDTHAAVLLRWLTQIWNGGDVTPDQIRSTTGLSQAQFKEAKKNPTIRRYFEEHVTTSGSGRNTVYRRKAEAPAA